LCSIRKKGTGGGGKGAFLSLREEDSPEGRSPLLEERPRDPSNRGPGQKERRRGEWSGGRLVRRGSAEKQL